MKILMALTSHDQPGVDNDDNLITGQNPASSEAATKTVLKQLRARSFVPRLLRRVKRRGNR